MSKRNFRTRRTSSTSEEDEDTEKEVQDNEGCDSAGEMSKLSAKEKIEELKFIQKQRERKNGIDVYSLAIGEQKVKTTKVETIENDPWKKKTGGLVDMKVLKVQRENEIVTSMASNFAKETNQRDEDAEMQKFIEEQIDKKKMAEKRAKDGDASTSTEADSEKKPNVFKRPEDALFDLPKYLITNTSKHRSEESLSEQMLSGIPEVDLGVSERIRNIEETERAKQKNFKISSEKTKVDDMYVPQAHFVQHKRFDDTLINPDHMVKRRLDRPNTAQTKDIQPVVGGAPKHELLQQSDQTQQQLNNYKSYKSSNNNNNRPNPNARRQYHVSTNERTEEQELSAATTASVPAVEASSSQASAEPLPTSQATDPGNKRPHKRPTEKASDDYCLERFKKNMRRNRSSKIKIA